MKVYLAARYGLKNQMRLYREELQSIGVEVTSRWLDERKQGDGSLEGLGEEYLRTRAQIDLDDIKECDVLVLFTTNVATPRGGRHHEAGYAAGLGKRIVLCGPRENIFHYLHQYVQCDDFLEVKYYLEYLGA